MVIDNAANDAAENGNDQHYKAWPAPLAQPLVTHLSRQIVKTQNKNTKGKKQ